MRKILLLKGHPSPSCLAKGIGFSWKFCVPVHSWRFLQDPVQNIWETITHYHVVFKSLPMPVCCAVLRVFSCKRELGMNGSTLFWQETEVFSLSENF